MPYFHNYSNRCIVTLYYWGYALCVELFAPQCEQHCAPYAASLYLFLVNTIPLCGSNESPFPILSLQTPSLSQTPGLLTVVCMCALLKGTLPSSVSALTLSHTPTPPVSIMECNQCQNRWSCIWRWCARIRRRFIEYAYPFLCHSPLSSPLSQSLPFIAHYCRGTKQQLMKELPKPLTYHITFTPALPFTYIIVIVRVLRGEIEKG